MKLNYPESFDFDNKEFHHSGLVVCRISGTVLRVSQATYRILWFLVENPKLIFSKKDLLKVGWDMDVSEAYVAIIISQLREFLSRRYILTLRGHGYYYSPLN